MTPRYGYSKTTGKGAPGSVTERKNTTLGAKHHCNGLRRSNAKSETSLPSPAGQCVECNLQIMLGLSHQLQIINIDLTRGEC